MCTIVVLRGVRADCPLILATNRDEFYARASSGAVRLLDQPSTVGGRDLVAMGTWMGVTREGLFVGVTNQRTMGVSETPLRSRGEVVLHALSLGDPIAIARYVSGLDGRHYNSFNLMWGNASTMQVAYGRREERAIELDDVPVGVHVLPNDRLDSPSFVKVERAKALIEPLLDAEPSSLRLGLQTMLADRALPALEDIPEPPPESVIGHARLRELAALCVRTPDYGTRSSTVVMLQPGRVQEYWYADGPPDRAPFQDVRSLF